MKTTTEQASMQSLSRDYSQDFRPSDVRDNEFQELTVARHAHGRLLLANPCSQLRQDTHHIRSMVLSQKRKGKEANAHQAVHEERPDGCVRLDDQEIDRYDKTSLCFIYVPETEFKKPPSEIKGLGTLRIIPSYSGQLLHAHNVTKKNRPEDLPTAPTYTNQRDPDPLASWIKNAGDRSLSSRTNPFIVEFSRLHISKQRRVETGYPSGISPTEFILAAAIRLTLDMHRVALPTYPGACLEHSVVEPALIKMRKRMNQHPESQGETFEYLGRKRFAVYNVWGCYQDIRKNRPEIFEQMSCFNSEPLFEYLNFGNSLCAAWTNERLKQTEHMLTDETSVHKLQNRNGKIEAFALRDANDNNRLLAVLFLNAAGNGVQTLWDIDTEKIYINRQALPVETVETAKNTPYLKALYDDLLKRGTWTESPPIQKYDSNDMAL